MPLATRSDMTTSTSGPRLMVSVAGIRGIVGESLTPPVVASYAGAFASVVGPGTVVVGRDARSSGPVVQQVVSAALRAAGCDVVDLGLAATPTVEVAVERLGACGGVILTASHNPAPWNALKLLSARGEFLDAPTGDRVRALAESGRPRWVGWERLGSERREERALGWHLERVLALPELDRDALRRRRLVVVVDGCRSVGGLAVPPLLEALGCEVVRLDCEPDGKFTRELEPLPENLGTLGAAVRESHADLGLALDPDADRVALVDERGRAVGEEYTLALAARVVLRRRKGPVVTNLSTSRMIDDVADAAGVAVHRTPVGEAHVVAAMRELGAIVGGEGNGGVILPAVHHGRDGLVGSALACQALLDGGAPLSEITAALPQYTLWKQKLERGTREWPALADALRRAFAGMAVDTRDGMRFSGAGEWIHVRPSGTEPVIRVIAESPGEPRTRELCERARHVLQD
jgi:phosphomannomutase